MLRMLLLLSIGLFCKASTVSSAETLSLEFALTPQNGGRYGGGQIVAYTPHDHTVVTTWNGGEGSGAQILTLSEAGSLLERGVALFNAPFGPSAGVGSVSSVVVDPAGRGFGVAAMIPVENGSVRGKIGFFDCRAGVTDDKRILRIMEVGYHPDCLMLSPDGKMLFVANEGEYTVGGANDAPGSVSIVDLSGIHLAEELSSLTEERLVDIDFSLGNIFTPTDLMQVRLNDVSAEAKVHRDRHIEPEFMCLLGDSLYVNLQENNAVAVLAVDRRDLSASKWKAIHSLGTITNTIDASNHDGPDGDAAAMIDDVVTALPMPDNIAAFEKKGRRFLVSANEGDFRPDDADRIRVYDFVGVEADGSCDETERAAASLGRLRVSAVDSDPDGDGLIDDIVAVGTRSISIWDAESGGLIADTGSLEPLLLRLDPTRHNAEDDEFDGRSPDKGPEPEGLALASINGRVYVIVTMERQNGILLFDVNNPQRPRCVGYTNSLASNLFAPESVTFVPAKQSPTQTDLALVGYEGDGGGVGVYSLNFTDNRELAGTGD